MLVVSVSLFATQAIAQNTSVILGHVYETCPDPVANKIKWRKYYELETDSTKRLEIHDTVIEYFNPKGKPDSVICINRRSENKNHIKAWRHLFYDSEGRVIQDTVYDDGAINYTTYEYHNHQTIIHHSPSKWSDILPTVFQNFDDKDEKISEYRVNANGDTVDYWERNGNVITNRWMSKGENGKLKLGSISMTVYAGDKSWHSYQSFYSDDTSKTTDLYSYNPDGTVREYIYIGIPPRRDTTHYIYENHLLKFYERRVFVEEGWSFIQYEQFSYNAADKLEIKKEWSAGYEREPSFTWYSYNERNLPIAIDHGHTYMDGRPTYFTSKDRFEYGYYE